MGSYAYTCGVSRLPIHAGDKVRYMLLSSTPYPDERACTASGCWFPRTFPLKAEYNDYGSVEEVESGVAQDLWLEGLKIDLAAVGVGDNSVHDIPTSTDMDFDGLLDAVVEDRVRVRQDLSDVSKPFMKQKTPIGVPTMQRVRKVLVDAGFTILSRGYSGSGFLVDKVGSGEIRVRWSGSGESYDKDTAMLKAAQKFLGDYATVVKAGRGAYAHKADLMVYVKPGTKDFHGGRKFKNKVLKVDALMIREEVWQGLLKIRVRSFYEKGVDTYAKTLKSLKAFYKKCREAYAKPLPEVSLPECLASYQKNRLRMLDDHKNPISYLLCKDEVPFTVGWGTHWNLFVQKGLKPKEAAPILEAVAGIYHVMRVLTLARWMWAPSYSAGPQFGEWNVHTKVNRMIFNVSDTENKREIRERRARGW